MNISRTNYGVPYVRTFKLEKTEREISRLHWSLSLSSDIILHRGCGCLFNDDNCLSWLKFIVKLTRIKKKYHNDVIKWRHFPRYWPFVRGIHRSPVNSPHKSQWRGALMFSLICVWINGRVNKREAGDLRRHHTHYDVTVMMSPQASLP